MCSFALESKNHRKDKFILFFDILLTVHLSIILAINQLNAQNLLS